LAGTVKDRMKGHGSAGKDAHMSAPAPRRRHAGGPHGPARHGRGRPPPAGDTLFTPGAGGYRRSLERASARPLLYLHQLPAWFPALVMAALLVAGLALPGLAGAAVLALLVAILGWLAALSWPALPPYGRLLRAAAVTAVLVLAVIRAVR
jgi:hypothetical protein